MWAGGGVLLLAVRPWYWMVVCISWMTIPPVGKTKELLCNILAFSSSLLTVPQFPPAVLTPLPASSSPPSVLPPPCEQEMVLSHDGTRQTGLIGAVWRIDRGRVWDGTSSVRSSAFVIIVGCGAEAQNRAETAACWWSLYLLMFTDVKLVVLLGEYICKSGWALTWATSTPH